MTVDTRNFSSITRNMDAIGLSSLSFDVTSSMCMVKAMCGQSFNINGHWEETGSATVEFGVSYDLGILHGVYVSPITTIETKGLYNCAPIYFMPNMSVAAPYFTGFYLTTTEPSSYGEIRSGSPNFRYSTGATSITFTTANDDNQYWSASFSIFLFKIK